MRRFCSRRWLLLLLLCCSRLDVNARPFLLSEKTKREKEEEKKGIKKGKKRSKEKQKKEKKGTAILVVDYYFYYYTARPHKRRQHQSTGVTETERRRCRSAGYLDGLQEGLPVVASAGLLRASDHAGDGGIHEQTAGSNKTGSNKHQQADGRPRAASSARQNPAAGPRASQRARRRRVEASSCPYIQDMLLRTHSTAGTADPQQASSFHRPPASGSVNCYSTLHCTDTSQRLPVGTFSVQSSPSRQPVELQKLEEKGEKKGPCSPSSSPIPGFTF